MTTRAGGLDVKRTLILGTVIATGAMLVMPFLGGAGPSPMAAASDRNVTASIRVASVVADVADRTPSPIAVAVADAIAARAGSYTITAPPPPPPAPRSGATSARAAVSPGAGCPTGVGGAVNGAPGAVSGGGVAGTTSADLAAFAVAYNNIRISNCLTPISLSNVRYDACMEQRLFWMAEDPSTNPSSAWGHMGSQRSDGVPSVGCDGNLAGGTGNSGATVAIKWWDSVSHRTSLYKPGVSTAGACIYFAMTHGGVPDEPYAFTRAAARWGSC